MMTEPVLLSEETTQHLIFLGSNEAKSPEAKLLSLIEAEYRRRLARYRLTDERLNRKYGISFAEFEEQRITEREGHSWEVDQDAIAWDQAIDGIATVERRLQRLRANQ